jgi:hypothetical protein
MAELFKQFFTRAKTSKLNLDVFVGFGPFNSISCLARSTILIGLPMSNTKISPPQPEQRSAARGQPPREWS